jgi:enamine deaminase RidA (YjgF/YER057c/UK114 family)
MTVEPINPPHLGRPLGYAHAIRVGSLLFLSGQIGGEALPNGRHRLVSLDFAPQFERALQNVVELVKAAGGRPENLVEMTVYVKDMETYRSARPALGDIWKRVLGRHYPAMTLVAVADLFEPDALVEVRAIAALE